MNCVRKHLSAIKGGRLARACAPARVVTPARERRAGRLAGDHRQRPDGAGSDHLRRRARGARALFDPDARPAVRARLESGELETPKPGDAAFAGHEVHIIATPQRSLEAAAAAARAAGIEAHILGDEIEGESREVGKVHAALARQIARRGQPFERPCVVLSGGETTVTVRPGSAGRGGRAGEFLLGCAIALQGAPEVQVLAADTDGIDGIEENAGAFVTPTPWRGPRRSALSPRDHARRQRRLLVLRRPRRPGGDRGRPSPTSTTSGHCWSADLAARARAAVRPLRRRA